jgi:cytoskeleton protein RodZ
MNASNADEIEDISRDRRQTTLYRARPDGELDPAGEAGWYLQREREKRGEAIDAAGEAAGIHPYHLEAIEEGDLTRLPQRLEALEMIGNYAQYLGFDPEPLVKHYAEFLPRPRVAPAAAHPANPQPLSSAKVIKFGNLPRFPKFNIGNLPGGAGGIVASCLGAVLLFAAASWTIHSSHNPPAAEQVAETNDDMPTASTASEKAEVKVSESALPDDQPATVLPGGQTTTGVKPLSEEDAAGAGLNGLTAFIEQTIGDPAQDSRPADKPLGQIASTDEAVQTPDGRVFGSTNDGSRLVLKAKAPVWVRIEDAQGNVVMTQMLMAGDRYRVPARDGLVVIARDGGLLAYEIDGKERGLLGTPGEILVGRPLDIATLGKKG